MDKPNIKQFSLPEMVSNDNGKTSGSGAMGCLCISIGCIGFAFGVYDYAKGTGTNEVLSQSMMLIMVGAGLLGIRKVGGSFGKTTELAGSESPAAETPVTDTAADASEKDAVDKV